MPKNISLEDILKKHPNVDIAKLSDFIKLNRELAEMGVAQPTQRLASPLKRRRITPSAAVDSRTVHLGRR
jgi:hypothetical protein